MTLASSSASVEPIPARDLYPSRIDHETRISPRHDAIFWGDAGEGPLSEAQCRAYEEGGYLLLTDILSNEEVAAARAELEALIEQYADTSDQWIVREPASKRIRSIFAVHKISDLFARLLSDRRLVAIAEQILGSRTYLHQTRLNFKPGFQGREFFWHSDFETWHVEDGMPRPRALSMAIALYENTPANGPVMMIPGSHRQFIACPGGTPENHYKQSLRQQMYGVPDETAIAFLAEQGGIELAAGPAGTITVFDSNIMHGSNSNISPLPRSNLFAVYNSAENMLEEPFGNLQPRPDFIAHRGKPKLL